MGKNNDRTLRFYNEVLGLERLHYGIWLSDDELTIEKLKEAQIRYEDYLIENIPDSVNSILDVGCGMGSLARKLIGLGYHVEGLSPDITQKQIFTERIDATFHHTTFEDFSKSSQYDCIIMSESAQYINLDKIFVNARRLLNKKGYLIVCDYFVLKNAMGILSKSGHDYDSFMDIAKSNGFVVLTENDITESVLKTLDLGKDFINRALLAGDIGTEGIRRKHPYLSRLFFWPFKKKFEKFKQQIQLLDSREFKNNKTYRFILFQVKP